MEEILPDKKELSQREILCMDLDEILEKRPDSFTELLQYLERAGYEIKEGKQVSVRPKKGGSFIRFRSLGVGYTEAEIRDVIGKYAAGRRDPGTPSRQQYHFSLMKDFEQILQQKKGKGYEKWAMHFNNSQAAEVLIFLQEKNIDSYEKLDALTENATDRFHVLSEEIKTCEAKLKELGALKKAIVDYSKTRSTYEAYRKTGYSKKFLEARREEITIHRAAKKTFDAYPSQKIPKVKELSEEYTEVLNRKKAAYKEYRTAKKEMQQYTIARKNVEMLLGRGSIVNQKMQISHGKS